MNLLQEHNSHDHELNDSAVKEQSGFIEQVPAPPKSVKCTVCDDDIADAHGFGASCGHPFCSDCLENLHNATMTDESLFPPRCCKQQMPWKHVKHHLQRECRQKFSIKRIELKTKNRTYCHRPECSTFIDPATYKLQAWGTCTACYSLTCIVCKGPHHYGRCPRNDDMDELAVAAQAQGWKKCFGCGRMVELIHGCNHIRCLCKSEWCYKCSIEWKNCTCAQWDENRLIEQAQAVVDLQSAAANEVPEDCGARIQQTAERLRAHHECDHERLKGIREEGTRYRCECQLDDLRALEEDAAHSGHGDQQTALLSFKEELESHQALRPSLSPTPGADDNVSSGFVTPPQEQLHEEDSVVANRPKSQHNFFTQIASGLKRIFVPGVRQKKSPPAPPCPEAPLIVPTFTCVACTDRFDADHCWQAPCEHWYCDEDLARLFRGSMTNRALYPPRCCRQPMPFAQIEHFLDTELAQAFAAKIEELDESQPTYCHAPTCSTYLGQANMECTKATWPCGLETCVLCKQEHQTGDCPADETSRQTEALAREQGWQRCIDCRQYVELKFGCNHMTCHCGGEFCYVCEARWRTCGCPQFNEERLLARGQHIAEREGRDDVAAVVEEVRQNHECANHR